MNHSETQNSYTNQTEGISFPTSIGCCVTESLSAHPKLSLWDISFSETSRKNPAISLKQMACLLFLLLVNLSLLAANLLISFPYLLTSGHSVVTAALAS